jgi:3-ketosteroid 9alpha-monooxygenase subunit A
VNRVKFPKEARPLEVSREKWREARGQGSAKQLAESQRFDDEYPYHGIPSGWFQVAWSAEIEAGQAIPMRYFGADLVAWREQAGQLHVMDAYCPHLGAHLGYGGCVEGGNIRCPYHGWVWNGDGKNVEIPLIDRVSTNHIRTWSVVERGGIVLVWHHPDRKPPQWDPPVIPEVDEADRYCPYPSLTHLWADLKIRPQYVVENTIDIRHQQWVHESPSKHSLLAWEVDGSKCRTRQRLMFGEGRESTWLTPKGPVEAFLDVEAYGIGLNVARFDGTDNSVIVGAHTPIDEWHIDERTTVFARREAGYEETPSPKALKRFEFHVRQVELDIVVWENMRYVVNPPYTADESKIWREFRTWAAQFYASDAAVLRPDA